MAFGDGHGSGGGFRPTLAQIIAILLIIGNLVFFALTHGGELERFRTAADETKDHEDRLDALEQAQQHLRYLLEKDRDRAFWPGERCDPGC